MVHTTADAAGAWFIQTGGMSVPVHAKESKCVQCRCFQCGSVPLRSHIKGAERITDFSYPRPFVPKNERSLWRTFVPQERKFQELSFPGPFVPGNFRSRGTKVLWNFRSGVLSFSGTFVPGERKFLGTFVPGTFCTRELLSPYLCALVYNSSLGAARISVFDVPINVA